MIGRLLCFFNWHKRPPGVSKRWSFIWACARCSTLVQSDLARRLKR